MLPKFIRGERVFVNYNGLIKFGHCAISGFDPEYTDMDLFLSTFWDDEQNIGDTKPLSFQDHGWIITNYDKYDIPFKYAWRAPGSKIKHVT